MKTGLRIFVCVGMALVLVCSLPAPFGMVQVVEAGGSATFVTSPMTIDGKATDSEWSTAQIFTFTNFKVRYKNDEQFLYLLLDVLGDTGNDPLSGTEYSAIVVDVNKDNLITGGVDLMYGFAGASTVLKKSVAISPTTWTGAQPSVSYAGVGFGTSPDSSTPHRIYEFAIRDSEMSAKPGSAVRMGFAVRSTNPAFNEIQPPTAMTDFTSLNVLGLASPQVAYVYNTADSDGVIDASDFQAMLYQTSGYWATLVPLDQVELVDFSPYLAILVASDTGTVATSTWLGSSAAVAKIRASRKPVVGVGLGGGRLFDELDLDIGYLQGWGTISQNIGAFGGLHYAWNTPVPVTLASTIQVYTADVGARGVYRPTFQSGILPLALDSTDVGNTHYSVITQVKDQVCFTVWGFYGHFAQLTANGKALLSNLVANPACIPPVAILYGSDTAFRDSLGLELANTADYVVYVQASDTAAVDLSPFRAVIVTPDSSSAWSISANVEALKELRVPIMAMGAGGAVLLDKLGLTAGWPHTMIFTAGNDGTVVNPLDLTFRYPYRVAFDSSSTDLLYSSTPTRIGFYHAGHPEAQIKSLIHNPSNPGYDLVVTESREGVCYTLWGYEGAPSGMTVLGKMLFKNLLFQPQCNWSVHLPVVIR